MEIHALWASLVTLVSIYIGNNTNNDNFSPPLGIRKRQRNSLMYTWISTSAHHLETITLYVCMMSTFCHLFLMVGPGLTAPGWQKQLGKVWEGGREISFIHCFPRLLIITASILPGVGRQAKREKEETGCYSTLPVLLLLECLHLTPPFTMLPSYFSWPGVQKTRVGTMGHNGIWLWSLFPAYFPGPIRASTNPQTIRYLSNLSSVIYSLSILGSLSLPTPCPIWRGMVQF